MNATIRNLLLGGLLSLPLAMFSPAPAQADDYWDGYWGWYDNTYRPYQYRQYARSYYGPGYGYYAPAPRYSYGPAYSPGYSYGPAYYGGPYYGGAYYGTPRVGYSDFGPYGGAVSVGPVRFGWR